MPANVGGLQIGLDLDLGQLIKKSTLAQKQIAASAAKMSKTLSDIGSGVNFLILTNALGGAGRAVGALSDFVREGADEAMAAEKSQRQLTAALGGGTSRIMAMTAALQRRTGADADAMNQQAAVLASMGLTTDQIERAIPAIRAYADVTGKNASAAVKQLGKAFEEGKLDEKIDALSVFIPAADAATDTFSGTVERLTRNLGELQEELGSSVVESESLKASLAILDEQVIALTGNAEGIGPLLGDGLAKAMGLAARAVASLAGALSSLVEPVDAAGASLSAFLVITNPLAATLYALNVAFPEMETGLSATAAAADKFATALDGVTNSSNETAAGLAEVVNQFSVDPSFEAKARAASSGKGKGKKKGKGAKRGKAEKMRFDAFTVEQSEGSAATIATANAIKANAALLAQSQANLDRLVEIIDKLKAKLEELLNAYAEIATFAGSVLLDAVFQPLEDGVLDLEKIIGGVKAAVLDLIKQLITAAALKAAFGIATGGVGGAILTAAGFADGGPVGGSGGPRSDNVPAWLSPGEYVMDAATVSRYGSGFFSALQRRKLPAFANGGLVGAAAAAGYGGSVTVNIDGRGMDEDTLARAVGRALRQAGIRGDSDLRSVLPTSPTSLLRRG